MQCAQCGQVNNPGVQFCVNCGASIAAQRAGGPGGVYTPSAVMENPRGFFGALFDFSFSDFITTRLIQVLYILSMVGIGFGALIIFLALASQGGGAAIVGLIITPIFALFYLIWARVWLEFIIVIFRIMEYTREIARQGRR